MAEVPYKGVPTVEPSVGLPDDYQRISGAGEGLKELGAGIDKLGAGVGKASTFYSQVTADDAFNQYQDRATKLLYGDPSKQVMGPDGTMQPDTGFMGLKGDASLRAADGVNKQLDALMKQTRAGLSTGEALFQFDQYSRRFRTYASESIGRQTDAQSYVYYKGVNDAGYNNAITHIATDPMNDTSFNNGLGDAINFKVKQAETEGAQKGDAIWQRAVTEGTKGAWTTRIEAAAARDPAAAYKMLQENQSVLGVNYDPLAAKIRPLVADKVLNDRVYKNVQPPVPPAAAAGVPAGRPALRLVSPAPPPLSAIPAGAGSDIAKASLGQDPAAITKAWDVATGGFFGGAGLQDYFGKMPKDVEIATARNFEAHPELWNAVPETIKGFPVRRPLQNASADLLRSVPPEEKAAPTETVPLGARTLTGYGHGSSLPGVANPAMAADAAPAARAAPGGPPPPLTFTPGRTPNVAQVDKRLQEIVAGGAMGLPEGYRATVNEGFNPAGHEPRSQHHIAGTGALDMQIWDPQGRPIKNSGDDPTGMYHLLARNAYHYMLAHYPELNGRFASGIGFETSAGSGRPDLMHFDIGGAARMAKYGSPWGGGQQQNIVDRIMGVDSGGAATARPLDAQGRPLSDAYGAGQFTSATWMGLVNKYRPDLARGRTADQILALRGSVPLSREMNAHNIAENTAYLTQHRIPTTPANVYLAHFLGPAGAAAVLGADPSEPVAGLLGADQIRANTSVLQGKTAGEVAAWAEQKMASGAAVAGGGGDTGGAVVGTSVASNGVAGPMLTRSQVMSDALAFFPDDPEMQRLYISRGDALANEIKTSSALDATEIKRKSDAAANGYMTAILGGTAQPNILSQIANDPNMTWETKESLTRAIESHADDSNVNATASYGTGFWGAYKQVNAPVGDPSRISDIAAVLKRAGPGGDLTLAGAQKLATIINANKKNVDDAAVNRTKLGLLDYAKDKLSFDQDTMVPGAPPLKDPRGRQIFEGTFIPQFEAAYDKWTKEGKDPWQFLTKDNVEKLIGGLRSPREMALAKLQAAEGTLPQGTQLPPAPQGVDEQGWREVMSVPVVVAGAALPLDKWQTTIERLAADPTETNKAWFDYHFGPSFSAAFGDQKDRASDVVLDALGISAKQALPPDERPSTGKPAAAAAPSAPAAPAVAAAGEAAGAPPTIFNPVTAAVEGLRTASGAKAAEGARQLERPDAGTPTLPPPQPGEPLSAYSPLPDHLIATMMGRYRQTLEKAGKFTAKEIDQMVSDEMAHLKNALAPPAAPEKPSPPYFGGMVRG